MSEQMTDMVQVGVALIASSGDASLLHLTTTEDVRITFALDDAAMASLYLTTKVVFESTVATRASNGKPAFFKMSWEDES